MVASRRAALAAALACIVAAALAHAQGTPDVLWRIASGFETNSRTCVVAPGTLCPPPARCTERDHVWAKNDRFVAIADRKMCAASCRAPFVHGLVLPRLAP